jgi:hypothetical protein
MLPVGRDRAQPATCSFTPFWGGEGKLTQVGFSLARPETGEQEKRTGEYLHQVA